MRKKLLTTKLKETLDQHPLGSTTGNLGNALCIAVFCVGPIRWYVFEGSECGTNDYLLSVVVTNWIEDEVGMVSIQELQDLTINPMIYLLSRPFNNGLMQAMPLQDFKPCRLKDIKDDPRLTRLLKNI